MYRRTECIEMLRGCGKLMFAGREYPVDYVVKRFRDHDHDVPGRLSSSGSLTGLSQVDCVAAMNCGKPLELTFADARRMKIELSDSNGHFRGTGPVEPAAERPTAD